MAKERLVGYVLPSQFWGSGWGNGYVAIPASHPLYKVPYDADQAMEIPVHGGITYSAPVPVEAIRGGRPVECLVPNLLPPAGWWVFGFDTCHSGDTPQSWPHEKVLAETEKLLKILDNLW
jgi:hypothetical protein